MTWSPCGTKLTRKTWSRQLNQLAKVLWGKYNLSASKKLTALGSNPTGGLDLVNYNRRGLNSPAIPAKPASRAKNGRLDIIVNYTKHRPEGFL
jgi:hypothetical protein